MCLFSFFVISFKSKGFHLFSYSSIGKPDAPEPPKADRVTKDSVTLSWRPPRHDGGSTIKGYIVQKKKKGDKDWSDATTVPVPNTIYTVSMLLVLCTQYFV